jgi:hypothetical protein
MFEKMRDSVQDQSRNVCFVTDKFKVRQHVGIEITGNKLDDLDEKIASDASAICFSQSRFSSAYSLTSDL